MSSSNSLSNLCEPADVRVLRRQGPQSKYKLAYVLILSRIYWKEVKDDGTDKPESLFDFRDEDSVELVRLKDHKTWDEDADVAVDTNKGRLSITISGRPHGRTRRRNALLGNVQVEIISRTPEQHEGYLNQVRARITPWSELQQEIKNVASRSSSSGADELKKTLGGMVTSRVDTEPTSMPTDEDGGKWRDELGSLPEQMAKLSIVDKLTAHGAGAVGTGATLEALVASGNCVAEKAKLISDVSRVVGGVSTIFNLLALIGQGLSMYAEASRGRRILPATLYRLGIYLEYAFESMTKVMKQSQSKHKIDEEFVFDVLKVAVGAMDIAETQVLRGRGSEFLNSEDVKEVETKLDELKHKAVTAGHSAKISAFDESWTHLEKEQKVSAAIISAIDERVIFLEEERELSDDRPHHERPSISPFFSGRTRELGTLREILEKQRSAVITQYGGAGKTELMIALADRAVQDGVVPGGVFWVSVDGGERDVIESLAKLAEKLTKRKLTKEERRIGKLVVATLKHGLCARDGRWLLCLDNADDRKVCGILNEVCGIVEGMQDNGWVVVTSRQGQPHTWNTMKKEQKLVLEPLNEMDAMVALWRQVEKIKKLEADDNAIIKQIEELENSDADEYRALKDLCGDEGGSSLGGLPLALVQAGAYIAQFGKLGKPFSDYQCKLKDANRIEDFRDIMRNTEDLSQKSIWTTWKISVGRLTAKAYAILRAMAMLGPAGVEKAIVVGILEEVASVEGNRVEKIFCNIVIDELVHGSSLICRYAQKREQEEMYKMHRLVRLFILNDMERGSAVWNEAYSAALICVHEAVKTKLGKEGKSFRKLPDVFGKNHDEIGAHAAALVDHHTLPVEGAEIRDVSKVEDVHLYSGIAMEFMGNVEKEIQVWKRLVGILEHRQVTNRRGTRTGCLLDAGNKEKPDIAFVLNSLGVALMRNGEFDEAASKLNQTLEMKMAIHGPNTSHKDIATLYNNLGMVYDAVGKLDDALDMHEKSLEMYQVIHAAEGAHPAVATSLSNVGVMYQKMGELGKALERHKQSLEMKLEIHGPNKPHPAIAASLNNIGILYEELGELEKAVEKHEKSLKMELAIHGPNKPHPDISTSLSNLGTLYQKVGRLEESLKMHERSLAMNRAIHRSSKVHPAIATSLSNLGNVYEALGKLEQAVKKHKESLDMKQAIYGFNTPHPNIASSLNNLGNAYRGMGKLRKALEKYQQSLEMRLIIHGTDKPHRYIATSLNNIGNVYEDLGELQKALETHEQCLKMERAIHGANKPHPDVASSLYNLGYVYERLGDLGKALEMHEQSLQMRLTFYGSNKPHHDTAKSLNNVGSLYRRLDRLDESLEKHEKSFDMYVTIHGRNKPHADIASSLTYLGNVYLRLGRLDEALEKHERSLEMHRTIHETDKSHSSIATSLNNLGMVYVVQGKLDKALEEYKKVLKLRREIRGSNKPDYDIATSLWSIGYVYHMQKNLEEAADFLEQSLEMLRAVHGQNSLHPEIAELESHLANVHQEQRRQNESLHSEISELESHSDNVQEDRRRHEDSLDIREQNIDTNETSDAESSNRNYRLILCAIFFYVTLLYFVTMFPYFTLSIIGYCYIRWAYRMCRELDQV